MPDVAVEADDTYEVAVGLVVVDEAVSISYVVGVRAVVGTVSVAPAVDGV